MSFVEVLITGAILGYAGYVLFEVVASMCLLANEERGPPSNGPESLVGQRARVTAALTPDGRVRLNGENWKARTTSSFVEVGSAVQVVRVRDLTLVVAPSEPSA